MDENVTEKTLIISNLGTFFLTSLFFIAFGFFTLTGGLKAEQYGTLSLVSERSLAGISHKFCQIGFLEAFEQMEIKYEKIPYWAASLCARIISKNSLVPIKKEKRHFTDEEIYIILKPEGEE